MVRQLQHRTVEVTADATLNDGGTGGLFGMVGFGVGKGISAAAKALFKRLAHIAEQARVAKVWKAANEKPYTGNPEEISCSNPGQAANTIADTTARLQSHVDQAVADFDGGAIAMSSRQARAVGRNPNLQQTYRGQVIDSAVKNATRNDSALSHLWLSRSGEVGSGFPRHRYEHLVGRDDARAVVEPRRLVHLSVRSGDRSIHAMSSKMLLDRWKSSKGRTLAAEAIECLTGVRKGPPEGFGTYEGRRDLRGLVAALPVVRGLVASGQDAAEIADGLVEVRGVQWEAFDLSHARLPSLRFFGSQISGCRFDEASCRDWRLWASEVSDSSFVGSDLRDSAIGTWQDGRSNVWRAVSFDRADLRGALGLGCHLDGCTFRDSRMSDAQFQQVTMRDCTFSGAMKDVLFDCRELPGKPTGDVLVNIDFSDATFEDVEFRGCRFDGVKLPQTPGVYAIPGFPQVARRVLDLLEENLSVEARMLRSELKVALKLPGRDDSVGVFNRRDYLASGGESLADLAESLLMEAIGDANV